MTDPPPDPVSPIQDLLAGRELFPFPLNRLPLAYIQMDVALRVLDWNPAAETLFGYTREEALGRDLLDLIVMLPLNDSLQEVLDRVLAGDMQAHSINENRTKDGRIITCEWFNTPLAGADGRFAGIFSLARDITERRRAEEALRESADRLQVLSRRVIEVQEEERRHLARELHDEIGQVLSAVVLNLQAVRGVCGEAAWPYVEASIAIVDRAIQQIRNLSLDLRPSMLDDLGLVAALRWYGDRQAQRAGFVLHFAAETSGARLPAGMEIACYRVAQEALTNVTRHAQARHVWLDYRERNEAVELVIRDDGVGFDPAAERRRAASGASFGVLGMQERVELLGGQFGVDSRPSQGTSVRLRMCLPMEG